MSPLGQRHTNMGILDSINDRTVDIDRRARISMGSTARAIRSHLSFAFAPVVYCPGAFDGSFLPPRLSRMTSRDYVARAGTGGLAGCVVTSRFHHKRIQMTPAHSGLGEFVASQNALNALMTFAADSATRM